MSDPILEIKSLSFRYAQYPYLERKDLFNDLNLKLNYREITLVLGKPESGKTTLSRILMGLVPRFSSGTLEGSVLFKGQSLLSRRTFDLIPEMGIVFQNPDEQLFSTSAASEIAFALESLGLHRKEIAERVDRSLELMDIQQYRIRHPDTLSGGEKKKLLLACLIAQDPDLWILDETLEELDHETRIKILDYLRTKGKTALIFSAKWHDYFEPYLSSLYRLDGGEVNTSTFDGESLIESSNIKRKRDPEKTSTPILEVESLLFRYPGAESFSLNIDHLCLYKGEVAALMGNNGSGKTTLAKLLCGLLNPEKGAITFRQNEELIQATQKILNAAVGYMFQNPDLQIFLPTVRQELTYGLERSVRKQLIDKVIADFRLPALESAPAMMSYGARKRLQGAVYFLLNRPVIIIDEGDSGLDIPDFQKLVELLYTPGSTLLLITHDEQMARRLAQRILYLEGGVLV